MPFSVILLPYLLINSCILCLSLCLITEANEKAKSLKVEEVIKIKIHYPVLINILNERQKTQTMKTFTQATDLQLVQAFQQGNNQALEVLVNKYKDKIFTSINILLRTNIC